MATIVYLTATPLVGQDAPKYLKDTYPKHALKTAIEARKALVGEGAKLDAKKRALIAIGVAAQIPCEYCVYINHIAVFTKGASEDEIREAVAVATQIRHWSTVLYGMDYDIEAFKMEVGEKFTKK